MAVDYSEDLEYAQAKLSESIVTLGERLVYILRVEEHDRVLYSPLGERDREICALKELDLSPIKLGYVNLSSACHYVWRTPARHYRQGLRQNVIRHYPTIRDVHIYSCKELVNTARGIFPSIENCYEELVCGEAVSRAFSREFALVKGKGTSIALHFKMQAVGGVNWGDRGPSIELQNNFRYLNELLMETLDGQKNL